MRPFVVAGAVVLMVLHFVVHVGFGWRGGAPDLATLGLLIAARELRMGTGAGVGFFLGLLEDSLGELTFGASTMALALVGAVGARTRDLFVGDSLSFVLIYLFVGKWTRDAVQWLMTAPELREPVQRALLVDATLASLYVAAVGLVLVRIFGNVLEKAGPA